MTKKGSQPVYSYLTLAREGTGLFKDKGSKFLSFAFPVATEADAKARLEALRKEYFDARHHCFAWVLGPDKTRYRASDDGEPNHSAGDPILGQIRSRNLTNTMVVVVRYFGGTKLGVGGLVVAYKTAADEALSNAVVEEREVTEPLEILYAYDKTPETMKLVKDFGLTVVDQKFEERCLLQAVISLRDKERFIEKCELLRAMGTPMEVRWPEA